MNKLGLRLIAAAVTLFAANGLAFADSWFVVTDQPGSGTIRAGDTYACADDEYHNHVYGNWSARQGTDASMTLHAHSCGPQYNAEISIDCVNGPVEQAWQDTRSVTLRTVCEGTGPASEWYAAISAVF